MTDPARRPGVSRLAIAAFVTSVVGLALCWLAYAIVPAAATLMGVAAEIDVRRRRAGGGYLATAAIVFGVLGVLTYLWIRMEPGSILFF